MGNRVKSTQERKRILLLEIEENRAAVIGEVRAVRRSIRSAFGLTSIVSRVASLFAPVARIAGILRGSRRTRGGFLYKLAIWLPIALPIIQVLRRRG